MSSALTTRRNGSPARTRRRQHGLPAHARPRHDGDLRALGQRHVVVGGDRVGEHAELELALAIGLQADAGRALPAVAEADGDGVAGREEILHHADVERAAPGADVALELPLGLERRAVGGLHRGVARRLGVGELHRAEVGGEAEADLDRAGVVDAERAGRVGEREALHGARLEAARTASAWPCPSGRGGSRSRACGAGSAQGADGGSLPGGFYSSRVDASMVRLPGNRA